MVKKSGVVRKIDTLGRIVIPIGIRKQLRIRDDETLSISIEDGRIVLEKYKALVELSDIVEKIISVTSRISNIEFIVTDNEKVINVSKPNLKEVEGKLLTSEYIEVINSRKKQMNNTVSEKNWIKDYKLNTITFVVPFINEGVVIGSILLVSPKADESKQLLVEFISNMIIMELNV